MFLIVRPLTKGVFSHAGVALYDWGAFRVYMLTINLRNTQKRLQSLNTALPMHQMLYHFIPNGRLFYLNFLAEPFPIERVPG